MSSALERRDAVRSDMHARLERMLEIRALEEEILRLCTTGAVHGITHLSSGQEAVSVAIAATTAPTDWVCGTYRSHGLALALGMTPVAVVGEILGRSVGCVGGRGGTMHLSSREIGLFPTSAIVGAGLPMAAGAALTAQVNGTDAVAVAVFGDGACNIGAFHETLNLARVWRLPTIFVCENNLYGEYSRISRTTPFSDLTRRADAYAIPAFCVDGQDIDNVIQTLGEAVARARAGEGPAFVEAKTYRYSGHAHLDKGTYRDSTEVDEWLRRDPISIARERMVRAGALSDDAAQALADRVSHAVEGAVASALASPPPDVSAMFDSVMA